MGTDGSATTPREGAGASPVVRRRGVLAAVIAGLLAGLAGWGGTEAVHDYYMPPKELLNRLDEGKLAAAQVEADSGNAILASGLLGAAMGLALGIAGGVVAGSPLRAAACGVAGAGLAGAAGVAAAWVLLPFYFNSSIELAGSLLLPMLTHAGIWSAIGVAAGLAFGLGAGGPGRAVQSAFGGLIGAALGTVVFELIGALAFASAGTDQPISDRPATRLMACMLVSVGTAAFASGMTISPNRRPPRPTVEATDPVASS